jgi:hypothetical protein
MAFALRELLPIDSHVSGSIDAQLHLIPAHGDHNDHHVIAYAHDLTDFARQH